MVHIHSLILQIRQGITTKKDTFCCYIDMQKAFNFLDRDLLLLKLLKLGITGKFYWAIKNSLTDTSSQVQCQGDVISPSLFSIYIN